jgi:hypothetical protein
VRPLLFHGARYEFLAAQWLVFASYNADVQCQLQVLSLRSDGMLSVSNTLHLSP